MMRIRIGVVLVLFGSAAVSLSWSADDEQAQVTTQKAAKQKGANRGAAVVRLLGPLNKAYAKMDADGDGKVTEEEFGKQLEAASNGRVKGQLGSQIFRTFDENGDGNLTLAELLKVESPSPSATPTDAAITSSETPAAPAPPVVLEARGWKSGGEAALPAARLDEMLVAQHAAENRASAALLDDANFLRRVTLDLTGRLPSAADVEAFLNTADTTKRSQAIDRLLASDDFGPYWGHFWRDVMQSKASSTKVIFDLHRGAALKAWLAQRLNANRSWAEIAHDLIAAQGVIYAPGESRDGNVGLMLCHSGQDAEVGRAVDTTRLFLGIQLECAQCHDHPTDIWKRQQFHELAAYFARLNDVQAKGEGTARGLQLVGKAKGEY
ncbi:MAG TPA: DUF1549 domain-containing protein, partial [Pirellulaceae bacterium]|nr:DUF1549 domain-containing protein [Pirellulaceae bacterium]